MPSRKSSRNHNDYGSSLSRRWVVFFVMSGVFLAQKKLDPDPPTKVASFPRPARPGVEWQAVTSHISHVSPPRVKLNDITRILTMTILTMSTLQELPDTRGLRLPHRAQRHEQRIRVIQPLRDHGQPGRIRCLQTQVGHWPAHLRILCNECCVTGRSTDISRCMVTPGEQGLRTSGATPTPTSPPATITTTPPLPARTRSP